MIYPNYRNDRIQSGYHVKKDIKCGDYLIKIVKVPEKFKFKNSLKTRKKLKLVKQNSKKIIGTGCFVLGWMTITNSNIDLLYKYDSPTEQVVQTERVDNSNFISKFEDIQNLQKNKLDESKKKFILDTIISLNGGALITEFICFIMFLKLLQLGYEAPHGIPPVAAQFPGANGFITPDIPGTKSNQNYRTQTTNSGPNSITIRTESELNMEKPDEMEQQVYNNIPKSIKRQLKDQQNRDRTISILKRPKLDLAWNQINFKTPKHFDEVMAAAGICPDPELSREEKTEMLRDFIYDTLTDPSKDLEWYENGQYQGGTPEGHDSINVLDQETGIVFSFKKYRGDEYLGDKNGFTTVFITSAQENANLQATGNLLTEQASRKYNVTLQQNLPDSNIGDTK